MENLLSKRPKNIILGVSGGFVLLAAVLYLLLFKPPHLDNTTVKKVMLSGLESIESALDKKISQYKNRAEFIFDRYRDQQLQHSELLAREALVFTQNNIIKDYYGEIYYFKFKELAVNDWLFIERKEILFFMQKMAENTFYVRYFCRLEKNFILERLTYGAAVKELTFVRDREGDNKENSYQYDQARNMFFYSHLLKGSNNQLVLHLKFSEKDIEYYYNERSTLFFYAVLFCFLLLAAVYFYNKKRIPARLLWLGMLVVLFISASGWGENNLYLTIGGFIVFYSLYQVLVVLIAVISLFYWLRDNIKIKPDTAAYLLFNAALLIMLFGSSAVVGAVNFNYTEFNINYFLLTLVVFLLHLLPFFFIRNIAIVGKPVNRGVFLLFQVVVVSAYFFLFRENFVNVLVLSIAASGLLFFDRKFLTRMAVVFLIAISIFHVINRHSVMEKKEFVAFNLKHIFLNQNNYAKFIAREIVHELNAAGKNFAEFFQEDSSERLKTIWKKSMGSRENIASGIFVLSPGGEILSEYSYQMQFLHADTGGIFPFWAIEDSTAGLYGKKISLAVASIKVVRKTKHLGRMIVQVLNSPELILRHQDKVNIFTIDKKINGMDLSYIKLNEKNQVVENPSNVNLENVADILKSTDTGDRWMTFRFIDIRFNGFVFRHNKNTFIIFFPGNTLFKNFSEIVKIFLFLLVFFFLFSSRDIKIPGWKSVYYSFSIRVFGILILISMLTAIIFSLFSINFNSQSSLRQDQQTMYERGRTAQNVGYNFLEEGEEFTPNHLVLISAILNSDVSVYKKGVLLETSNYRKIINYEVPNFLNSNILNLLNRKNQKFVLLDDEDGFHLYLKIYDYILDVEFAYNWRKLLVEEGYYTNFIITLFFILVIIGFSFAFFFRNKILSPINELNRGMAEVEKGELRRLKKIPPEIEIKNLYTGFNSMVEGIREQRKNISEISRMKTIIRLGRRVAHEVKNPLTPIKLSAEQILMALRDKNPDYENIIKQSVNYIIDETDHLKKVSYGFLDLSKLDELKLQPFDLRELIRDEVFKAGQVYARISFVLNDEGGTGDTGGGSFAVTLDKFKMKQVLKNLVSNSIEAMGEKRGEITLNLERRENRVLIEVVDNGIGMDEKGLELIYNIDYSTKKIGTGLGLFIVKRIIDLHKGRIEIKSEKNKGTHVLLDLPVKVGE